MRQDGCAIDNLLLGLAWLGEASVTDIQQIWMPTHGLRSVQRVLRELCHERQITARGWAIPRKQRTPLRQSTMWSLTERKLKDLRDHAAFPPKYLPPRARRSLPHDSKTSMCLAHMLTLWQARPDRYLSGVYIEREVRLDPKRTRPIMDALLMVRFSPEVSVFPGMVPWSKDIPLDDEWSIRYALENDRGSEPPAVIEAKAVAYQRIQKDAEWKRRYGGFPVPIWLVPTESRLRTVFRAWYRAWPEGKWLMTTDAWMQGGSDYWIFYDKGRVQARGLFRTRPTIPCATQGHPRLIFGGQSLESFLYAA